MHFSTQYWRCLVVFCIVSSSLAIQAQNLVPNHSFENVSPCPTSPNLLCDHVAVPWECPNDGTTDLFHACGGTYPSNSFSVPYNTNGFQVAHDGQGYAGMFCKWGANGREYAQAPLTSPLVAGQWYNVYFYVSKINAFCSIEHIGAYLSKTVSHQSGTDYLDYEPQVESDFGFITDTMEWVLISGCFQAEGGEEYITIGNFRDDAESPVNPGCDGNLAYYFVDDIHVEAGTAPEEIVFELGDPVDACFEYQIDPNHPGPYFHWSDGSSHPALNVTTSGTYTLTITDGCSEGIDSIEVTIYGNQPPVDLGPPTATICEGDSYSISLDPDLEEYEWQDGSTSPDYIITEAGVYAVTLSDACSESSDEITIDVIAAPLPVSLGDDVILCPGESTTFEINPSLGEIEWQDGSTDPEYTVMNSGNYAVSVSNSCGTVSDEVLVTVLEIPTVELGDPSTLLCTGESIVLELNPPDGDLIMWQDGSTESEYLIVNPGTYSVTVSNDCGMATDEVEVTGMETPFLELGPDLVLCEDQTYVLSPEIIVGATYVWQDLSDETDYLVTEPGDYALTITNSCGSAEDMVSVNYIAILAVPSLGPDRVLCPGETVVLYANTTNANILWQNQTSADSLMVTSSGTYWLELSNMCSSVADTVVITFNSDPPAIDLPSQISLCSGTSVTLDAGITGVTYQWSDQSTLQELMVTTPGEYSLTVSNACGTDMDTVQVIDGGPAPMVTLGADVELCPGDTFSIDPVSTHVINWLWQDGSTLPTYTVYAAETVIVSVNNDCGNATDTLEVTMLPDVPIVSLGVDTALCAQQSYTLTVSIPNVSVTWQDGSTDTLYTMTAPGVAYATISNACGQSSDTVHVGLLPAIPSLYLGADQSLCPGEIITLSPGIADVDYIWQDGSTNPSYQSAQAETIILTISNACGMSSDTLEIIASNQGPDVNLGPDIWACSGDTVTLESNISGVQFHWQDGSNASSLTTSQSGLYILEVSNSCGQDADTVDVHLDGLPPTISLGADTLLCDHETLTLHAETDAWVDWVWQDGTTEDSLVVTGAGLYILAASNQCGQTADSIQVSLVMSPGTFNLGPDTSLCPQDSLILYAPVTLSDWFWQDGSHVDSLKVNQPGVYALTASNACGTSTDTIVVHRLDTPEPFSLGADTTLCPGEGIHINLAPHTYLWTWQDGFSFPERWIALEGSYILSASNICGITSDTLEVDVDHREPVIHLDHTILWCENDTISLNVLQSFPATYAWSTGDTLPSIQVYQPGIYQIDITTPCAIKSADVEVRPDPACFSNGEMYIPNIFSPNGDHVNDVFAFITGPDIQIVKINGSIYDRWGNEIFNSTEAPFTWDGMFNGETLMPGVYVYRIFCSYRIDGQSFQNVFAGDVTLVR